MTKRNKLLERFLSIPRDFTYDELRSLLFGLGFEEENRGKTSGSRTSFYNSILGSQIIIHKPHPEKIMKTVYLKNIRRKLIEDKIV